MEPNILNQPENNYGNSAEFGKVPNDSESFRTLPQDSESFGNLSHRSETFRTVQNASEFSRSIPNVLERGEKHSLTVRESARMFETAGVARTERSIVNWCQPNAQGIARLDAYFDPNDRKYYITLQSVESAIAEEKAKAAKSLGAEVFGSVPNSPAEAETAVEAPLENQNHRLQEMEREIKDLKITNRGKDYFIDQLQKERDGMFQEVIRASRQIGELETKLLQLDSPSNTRPKGLPS